MSIAYLVIISQFPVAVRFAGMHLKPFWGSQNLFASFYEILLLLVGLKFLPKMKNILFNVFAYFGKSSYHIFLVQIVYFGLVKAGSMSLTTKYTGISDLISIHNISIAALSLAICLAVGSALYFVEDKLIMPRIR